MRFVIQRVNNANVIVNNNNIGEIQKGLLVFIGISNDDSKEIAGKMLKKLIQLRIFEDLEGKTNLSINDIGGQLLLVSQFTLYANCKKGNRPSFVEAGSPEKANEIYNYIIEKAKTQIPIVEQGEFGADMKINLENDGPFTIILDSEII